MSANPYSDLPSSAFWKTGVAQESPYQIRSLYQKKFAIPPHAKIATAGSCFAQHISRHLKKNGYNVLDVEPAPHALPENQHQKFGYSMYSARYGNIYTVQQLLQLSQEAAGERLPENFIWTKDEKFYDGLRPAIEPEGFDTLNDVIKHRQLHIAKVKQMFESLDVFIFTLGLTEMWIDKNSGTVFPTAPGTIVGEYNPNLFKFQNANFQQIINDFNKFQGVLKKIRNAKPFNIILTVSPVPLTATASGQHVLTSTTYSKSVLRSVAGQLSSNQRHIDYFPSYEIVLNPKMKSSAFADNLRSVKPETVEMVMKHFFAEHASFKAPNNDNDLEFDIQCEESILELQAEVNSINQRVPTKSLQYIEILANSHGASIYKMLSSRIQNLHFFYNHSFNGSIKEINLDTPLKIDEFGVSIGALHNENNLQRTATIFGGMNLFGDGIFIGSGGNKNLVHRSTAFDALDVGSRLIEMFGSVSSRQDSFKILRKELHIRLDLLEKALHSNDHRFVRWIPAPLAVESVAKMRYGSNYFESGLQHVVSEKYMKLVLDVFGKYVDAGIVMLPPNNVLGSSGFTLDKYRQTNQIGDRHVSPAYYSSIVQRLSDDFSEYISQQAT